MIAFHGGVTSGEKLSQDDKGLLVTDVFAALSNLNGQAIARDFARLSTGNLKDQDFQDGADNASACALASLGRIDESNREHYERAERIAVALGDADQPGAIAGTMLQMLFFDAIRQRFESNA
jgi:hypothetical protein